MKAILLRRAVLARWLPLISSLLALVFILVYFFPAPPSKVTIATSFKGGAYELFAQRYRDILARSGIKLIIRNTQGSGENLKLLQEAKSGVQIAFVQGGFSNKNEAPDIVSLGHVSFQPFWVFYVSDRVWPDLTRLKGKRIAVGPVGGGTRVVAEKVLSAIGISERADELLPLFGRPAADALKQGKVDAVFLPGAMESPLIQQLLKDPQVRLMNMPRAEALTRRFPFLVRKTLPAGVIDFERNIPPTDFTIIGTTTSIIAREDLHPEIVHQLAAALTQVHGDAGAFNQAAEFPSQVDSEYNFAQAARDYYRNGPSLLERYLPFWMTNYARRTLAVMVAVLAVLLPLFNFAARLYRWKTEERVLRLYRKLRTVEKEMQQELSSEQIAELQSRLELIDHSTRNLRIPTRHSDLFFFLQGPHRPFAAKARSPSYRVQKFGLSCCMLYALRARSLRLLR